MEIGTGIFWVGVAYFLVAVISQAHHHYLTRFPNDQVRRLDKIEKIFKKYEMED
jgi:hypothetical protein